MGRLTTTLLQATNLILLINSFNQNELKKFQVWQRENEEIKEVLTKLEVSRISTEDQLKIFEHPIETGTVITDHIILEPRQINIQAYISIYDSETLTELEQLYLSGTKLTVRAENKIIKNALIKSKPKEINSDVFDKTLYSITFREAEEKEPVYVAMPPKKVINKKTASRVNSGVKQATPQKQKNQSWIYNAIKGNK